MSDFITTAEGWATAQKAMAAALRKYRPPTKLTVSQWSDTYRRLSMVDSAEPGRWDTSVAEYQREPMDALTATGVEDVVLMCAAQVGKTQIQLNCLAFLIDRDPGPAMYICPTQADATEFSKDRFGEGLLRCTPALRGKVSDVKRGPAGKDASTIAHKRFSGGILTFAWANSPSRLSSRPVRYVFGDEIDKWVNHPTQGNPLERSRKRSATYRQSRRHFWCSTPTLAAEAGEGGSLIAAMYGKSSRGRFVVACPECKTFGTIGFFADSLGVQATTGFHLHWDRDEQGNHLPQTAYAICHACGAQIGEHSKFEMVRGGHWEHEDPSNSVRGYHVSSLVSPWASWSELAAKFLQAGHNSELLRMFWNEELGQPWTVQGEIVSNESLSNRAEHFDCVPDGVSILTAGVDWHPDRYELLVWGWGPQNEAWLLGHEVIRGDTNHPSLQAELDELLATEWEYQGGGLLGLYAVLIDAGFNSKNVHDFCRGKFGRRIFPCIGRAGLRPILGDKPTRVDACKQFTVGVDAAKEFLYRNLRITTPGPGYVHFDDTLTEETFAQLTAEKRVKVIRGGSTVFEWRKMRERNEALDASCYALAAQFVGRRIDYAAALATNRRRAAEAHAKPEPDQMIAGSNTPLPKSAPPSRTLIENPWVNSWR